MPERTALISDANLTTMARNIFGQDVVVEAFLAIEDYGDDPEHLRDNIQRQRFKEVTDTLDWDARTIVLQLTNGRKVLLSNSEWADSRLLTEDNYVYVGEAAQNG